MHINTAYAAVISVTTLILIALSSTLVTTISSSITSNIHTSILAKAAPDDVATVIVLPSIGGATSISAGTYNVTSGEDIALSAVPSEGFFFKYWVISGYMPGHDQELALDTNVTSTNPITIICEQGNTYRIQAVFTNSADSTLDNLPQGITLTQATETIAFLVAVSLAEAIILAVLYVNHMKKKHNHLRR